MNIRLNGIFYPPAAVKKAIRDYKSLADFAYREKSGYALVGIKNIRNKELKPLFRQEFCNYVLSLAGTLK